MYSIHVNKMIDSKKKLSLVDISPIENLNGDQQIYLAFFILISNLKNFLNDGEQFFSSIWRFASVDDIKEVNRQYHRYCYKYLPNLSGIEESHPLSLSEIGLYSINISQDEYIYIKLEVNLESPVSMLLKQKHKAMFRQYCDINLTTILKNGFGDNANTLSLILIESINKSLREFEEKVETLDSEDQCNKLMDEIISNIIKKLKTEIRYNPEINDDILYCSDLFTDLEEAIKKYFSESVGQKFLISEATEADITRNAHENLFVITHLQNSIYNNLFKLLNLFWMISPTEAYEDFTKAVDSDCVKITPEMSPLCKQENLIYNAKKIKQAIIKYHPDSNYNKAMSDFFNLIIASFEMCHKMTKKFEKAIVYGEQLRKRQSNNDDDNIQRLKSFVSL